MAEAHKSPRSIPSAPVAEALAEVCLEVAHGASRSTVYAVAEAGFLVGTVPGCDLRITGTDWPAVLCLIGRRPGGATIRKLCPTQPVLVNKKSITTATLAHGDRVKVGPVEMLVQMQAVSSAPVQIIQGSVAPPKASAAVLPEVELARQQVQEQIRQFKDRVLRFEQDKQRYEAEAAKRQAELNDRQKTLEGAQTLLKQHQSSIDPKPEQQESALVSNADEIVAQKRELAAARQELAEIRTQLYDRYQQRRDRLAALQESVNKAARKVQERKQQLDAELREAQSRFNADAKNRAELEARAAELKDARQQLETQRGEHRTSVAKFENEMQRRVDECRHREEKLNATRLALTQDQEQHKEDLLRFSRLRTELDDRAKQLDERECGLAQKLEQLHGETKDMESQVVQLDEWHAKLSAVGEKLAKQKAEQEQVSQQLGQRAAALEGQQAALAALRTRLERMREDTRQQEQQLTEQRTKQEAAEAQLAQKREDVDRLREELAGEKILVEQERRMIAERGTVLDTAVAQLRQAQERLAADEERVREQAQALDASAAQQAEAASLLQIRTAECDDLHKRLESERENLRERNLLLTQAEQARETLQEQLRRRSDELALRQKTIHDQIAQHDADAATLQQQREDMEALQLRHREALATERQTLAERAADVEQRHVELNARAQELQHQEADLADKTKALAEESQELLQERAKLDGERRAAAEAAQQSREELQAAKREANALRQHLPELELRAGTALERLTHGREQMRDHLEEVHSYAAQCREELEVLRGQVQAEAQRLQDQEQGLRRGQEEQRLAIAAFRQQLIDWQGQIADMKRLMASDETRLEQRQSQVAQQTKQLGADTMRLAQKAEQLREKEREVAQKRADIDRHLGDMREWYRGKLRELAGAGEETQLTDGSAMAAGEEPRRDILSLTGDVDPIDRKLGDLMRSLELIDSDTLTALLVQARRQRRSLRQVLLASGAVTLYQMALIEAGDLDALMLGPVRVIDRIRATQRETIYRVFDPRRGSEAVLRQLVESEAANVAHRDEFCRRFGLAMINHPNIAATFEVLDVADRPAVLQESLTGLASNDWPALAAVPGVWYRLILQASQALQAAHENGLIHGHLQPTNFVLTEDGVLKVSGFGEPAWLEGGPFNEEASGDLKALGDIATAWCPALRRKSSREKALPSGLQKVLQNLEGDGEHSISSATRLLDELEKAAETVPANPEAWDRLLKHVKDNTGPVIGMRQAG